MVTKLTPGEMQFMRECQSKFPPVHCPTVIIGEGLARRGLAYFERYYAKPTYWPHNGQWRLTDEGRAALQKEQGNG